MGATSKQGRSLFLLLLGFAPAPAGLVALVALIGQRVTAEADREGLDLPRWALWGIPSSGWSPQGWDALSTD
jgi:hypothetical protein